MRTHTHICTAIAQRTLTEGSADNVLVGSVAIGCFWVCFVVEAHDRGCDVSIPVCI